MNQQPMRGNRNSRTDRLSMCDCCGSWTPKTRSVEREDWQSDWDEELLDLNPNEN